MPDRISGKPLHVDTSDLPVKRGVTADRNKFALGDSDSGKSFFMNHLARQYYEQGTHVVLIDTGNSYQGLRSLIYQKTGGKDGIYFTYTDEGPIAFNPFSTDNKVLDIEKRESIKTLILTLWKKDNESTTRSEEVALSNAVALYIRRIKKDGGIVPSLNTFYEFVKADHRRILEEKGVREKDFDLAGLLNVLEPYYRGGEYDLLLNSDKQPDLLGKRFIVLEIDQIKDHPTLFPVTTIIIMELFISKMRRLKGMRKMIIMKEAWKAIAKEGVTDYIRYLSKAVHKFYGEAVVATQGVDNIISSPIVKELIMSNNDYKIPFDQRKYFNKFSQTQSLPGLMDKEKAQILLVNISSDPKHKYKEVQFELGSVQSTMYATEVPPEEYLRYAIEESEKVEVEQLAKQLDGNIKLAVRRFAGRKRNQSNEIP